MNQFSNHCGRFSLEKLVKRNAEIGLNHINLMKN